jgi:hypothetical protein
MLAARRMRALALIVLATVSTHPRAAAQAADSASAAAAGTRDGSAAGRSASMAGTRWKSAAATFFLTPFVGGVAVLMDSGHDPGDVPALVPPPPAPLVPSAPYVNAYHSAYRDEYLPRRRRTMRTTMIVTSVLFIGVAAAFSG